jgi:hypothetical protein
MGCADSTMSHRQHVDNICRRATISQSALSVLSTVSKLA